MSVESCIRSAKQWLKENSDVELNAKELEQVGILLDQAEKLGATPAEKNQLMGDLVDQKLEVAQAKNRVRKYINAIKNESVAKEVLANTQSFIESGMDKNEAPVEARRAFLAGGSARPGVGTNLDPQYMRSSTMTRYMQFLKNALEPEDLKILQATKMSDPLSRDITQELYALRKGTNLGQSNNDIALRLAKGIREAQDYSLKDSRAVNPYSGENPDFLFSRTYDRAKIAATPQDVWVAKMKSRFSGSFLGRTDAEINSILKETYGDIKAGVFGSDNFNGENFWKPKGTSGNQGAVVSKARMFVANDWKAEWQNAAEFGADSHYEALVTQLNRTARNVARFQKMGLDIADNYHAQDAAIYKNLDPEQKEAWARARPEFEQILEKTMGRQENEAWGMRARAAQALMTIEDLSQMGQHVPRSLSSIQSAMTLARDGFGKTLPENAFEISKGVTDALLSRDGGREAAQALGVTLRDVARDQMGDFAGGKQDFTLPAKAAQLMGKLSGANRQAAAMKYGLCNFTTNELGAHAEMPFEHLPQQLQDRLNRYNLGGKTWEVLRQAVETEGDMKGKIIAESPFNLTNEQLKDLAKGAGQREADRLRLEMSMNYGTMLNDEAGLVVGESNTRSQMASYGNTDINSGWGVARRILMQFRQNALVRQQLVQRTFRSGGGGTSNLSGTMQHMIGSAFLGILGESVLALSVGKTLPSPASPDVAAHALNSTGVFGLYGSVLASFLQEPTSGPSEAVKNAAQSIVGAGTTTTLRFGAATVKTGQGVVEALSGDSNEKDQYGGKEWAKLIHNLTPGQNLFYTKAALDFMFMNELHQFMGDGGYLHTLQMQTAKTPAFPEALGGPGGGQQFTFGGKNFWE